jgi:pyruvate/2-oxoacid:ferredoxin oxidoreductase beta subunit
MNTGIQRSSATPWGAWTTTTPTESPKSHPKKDLLAIMAAHHIPYAATATVAYPDDLLAKARRAKEVRGTRFLHILAPCPPGWKTADDETIELGRMAVQARIFPLLEVEDGERWRFTMVPKGDPVAPYIKRQGRFRHLTAAQIVSIQEQVDARWRALEARVHGSETRV